MDYIVPYLRYSGTLMFAGKTAWAVARALELYGTYRVQRCTLVP